METNQIQPILHEIDRLIAEMTALRSQGATLHNPLAPQRRSARQAEYLGMWADREDMRDQSSRAWLGDLRTQQWTR